MGFFSSLWDGIKTAAAITVGAPIALGAWAADKVGLIDLPDDVGEAEAIDENSSAQEINDSAEILEKSRSVYRADGERIEREIQQQITGFFDDLVERLEDEDELTADFDIDGLRRQQRNLMREIRGSLTKPISVRLSMDDTECMQILSMPPGSAKKERMERFCRQVFRDARTDLERIVEDVLYRQTDELSYVLHKYVENKSADAKRKKDELDAMGNVMKTNAFDAEQAQLKPKTKIFILDEMNKIIAA